MSDHQKVGRVTLDAIYDELPASVLARLYVDSDLVLRMAPLHDIGNWPRSMVAEFRNLFER